MFVWRRLARTEPTGSVTGEILESVNVYTYI